MLATLPNPVLKNIKSVEPKHLVGDKIQPGHPLFGLIWINRERVSGTPCFFGTRVPLKTLFDWLSEGETLDAFLDNFEGVDREQALAALELAGSGLMEELERL